MLKRVNWCYDIEIVCEDKEGNIVKCRIRVMADCYNAAIYKVKTWCIEQDVELIDLHLIDDFALWG